MTFAPDYLSNIASSPRDHAPAQTRAHLLMLIFVWIPIAVVFSTIVAGIASVALPILGFLLGPAIIFFITFSIHRNLTVQRERRAAVLLGYLENAVRLNLPLDKFLLAAEQSEIGKTRHRLASLRGALAQGFAITTALQIAIPEIAPSTLSFLHREEAIGNLQPALTRILQRVRRNRPTYLEDNGPFYRFYLGIVTAFLFTVMIGMMIFVVPKFRDIFKDFHTTLPAPTQFVMDFADFFANTTLGVSFLLLLALLLIAAIARTLQALFTPSLGYLFPIRFYQWFAWNFPLTHRLERDRALSHIFEFLADALRAGLPLHTALNNAAQLHINYHMHHKLLHWHANLLAGQPPAQAAQNAALPPLLVGLLLPGQTPRANTTPTSTPELFDFLARYYRQRFSALLLSIRSAAEPAIVLLLGAAVGFFVYSLFLPLTTLINSVANQAINSGVL